MIKNPLNTTISNAVAEINKIGIAGFEKANLVGKKSIDNKIIYFFKKTA